MSAARVHGVRVVAVRIVVGAVLMVQESMLVVLLKVRIERIELLPGGRLVAGGSGSVRVVGVVVEAERIGRTDLLRFAALEECDAHFGALRSAWWRIGVEIVVLVHTFGVFDKNYKNSNFL